jgi:DNA recombination protein RmuC
MDILSLLIGSAAGIILGLMIYKIFGRSDDAELRARLTVTTEQLETARRELHDVEARLETFQQENTTLKTTLEHERKTIAEKVELLNKAKEEMSHTFKSISQDVMAANRENFLSLAQERFKQFQNNAENDLEKRQKAIKELIDPVSKSLETMDKKIVDLEKAREGAYGELREHLTAMKTDQGKLRLETASLVQALRSPSARGQWGELQLIRTLEMAGMVEGVHYKQQVTTDDGMRPDVIVYLPGGQNIIIDAKSPIDAYLDSLKDGIGEEDRMLQLDRHARHVRGHFKMLGSKKYWEQFDTPEFVVMFLPGESYFSAALERDPGLIEAGVDSKVIPATPTTLIAMLRAVAYGWRQEALAANAKEISELGQELYKKLSVFGDHMARVGRGLDTAMTSYNKAVGSLENNVMRTARKFTDLQATPDKAELPDLKTLEDTPRKLTAVEFEKDDKEKA